MAGADIIPVDMAVSLIIAVAWSTAMERSVSPLCLLIVVSVCGCVCGQLVSQSRHTGRLPLTVGCDGEMR